MLISNLSAASSKNDLIILGNEKNCSIFFFFTAAQRAGALTASGWWFSVRSFHRCFFMIMHLLHQQSWWWSEALDAGALTSENQRLSSHGVAEDADWGCGLTFLNPRYKICSSLREKRVWASSCSRPSGRWRTVDSSNSSSTLSGREAGGGGGQLQAGEYWQWLLKYQLMLAFQLMFDLITSLQILENRWWTKRKSDMLEPDVWLLLETQRQSLLYSSWFNKPALTNEC